MSVESRSHHYQHLLRDLGMEVVVAGYEFAHRDDYEGRQVIPTIKSDADSKNIPELHLKPDEKLYREAHQYLDLTKEQFEELKKEVPLNYYEGMYPDMKDGEIMIDDCNHYELEELAARIKPDLIFTGVADTVTIAEKMGIPCGKTCTRTDYSGPYAGYNGAINFARDVAHALTTPAWKMIVPPWERKDERNGKPGRCDPCLECVPEGKIEHTDREDQPGKNLPADRRHVCLSGYSRLSPAQPRFARAAARTTACT